MHRRLVFLIVPLSMLACSTVNRYFSQPTPGNREAEEQDVYAVLLCDYERQNIVLSKTTDSGFDFTGQIDRPANTSGISEELWEDYLVRNDRSYPLSTEMEIGREYILLDDREMGDIFSSHEDGWDEFYSRYPESPGITTLSRVGFNPEGTEALVYMGTQFHYLAGAGNLVRLEKQNGEWKIVDRIMLWIS